MPFNELMRLAVLFRVEQCNANNPNGNQEKSSVCGDWIGTLVIRNTDMDDDYDVICIVLEVIIVK